MGALGPSIRFCESRDGTRLAYATIGTGPVLLHLPGFTTNIEFEWNDPEARAWIERIAARCTVVRCQRRGIGASQRDIADVSLSAQVNDIAAVVGRLEANKVAILAAYDAAPSAIAYVVAHPEQVSHLVLWSPFVPDRGPDAYDAVANFIEPNWQLFLRMWANMCFPSGPTERQHWYANMVRQSTSPEVVVAYIKFMRDVEVSNLLPQVSVPTIIFHRARDRYVLAPSVRAVAAKLPGATLVPLDGDIGIPVFGDASYLDRMFAFLGLGEPATQRVAAPVSARDHHIFRRQGDFWTIAYQGRTFSVRDTKGLQYIARLLGDPGRQVHCMDLSADEQGPSAEDRRRLQELHADLDEAETRHDLGQATRLRAEMDLLLAKLAGETDAHDAEAARARERARINVTRTIKDAIARIREHDGALARHLAHAVRTGAWCSYAPETEVRWTL